MLVYIVTLIENIMQMYNVLYSVYVNPNLKEVIFRAGENWQVDPGVFLKVCPPPPVTPTGTCI